MSPTCIYQRALRALSQLAVATLTVGAAVTTAGCMGDLTLDDVDTAERPLVPSGYIYTYNGWLDVESQYLPGVVRCELGWYTNDLDTLRAQAVAARTYLATRMEQTPSLGTSTNPIPTGPTFQCWNNGAGPLENQAASDTAGVVMTYGGQTIYANYASGAPDLDFNGNPYPPSYYTYPWSSWQQGANQYASGVCTIGCVNSYHPYAGTQIFVTDNEGRTGSSVIKTVHNSPTARNRGGFGQYQAVWLGEVGGYSWQDILRFFYGADIVISGDGGGTPPPNDCPSGDGYYCGGNGVDGDSDTLYYCSGGVASALEVCTYGCQANSAGVADQCNPPPSGGPGACSCGGGADFNGNQVPISSTHCGFRVCGGDFQLYECGLSGWTGLGVGCGGGCSCSGGADYAGNQVPTSSTHCGYRVCGGDFQYYDCTSSGWSGSNSYCN